MSYPKWVSRGYGLGDVLCLNAEEEAALLTPCVEAEEPAKAVETKAYEDGTVATGPAPLPEQSPAEQAAPAKKKGGRPRKVQ